MAQNGEQIDTLLSMLFQAHPWHGLPCRTSREGIFNAYIELVPTDTVKYELDKPTGHLRLDRPQKFSSLCPTLYGFIPQTYCGDEVAKRCLENTSLQTVEGDLDPMDICVLTEKSNSHGNFLAHVRPIGGLRMIDGNQADDKIVAVLDADIAFGHIRDIGECPPGIIERIRHYFLSYKQQPGNPAHRVHIAEVYGQEEALAMIGRSEADYLNTFGSPHERILQLRRFLSGHQS